MRASILTIVVMAAVAAFPAGASAGQAVCPCIADNSIASHSSEVVLNVGGASSIKIKGRENLLLLNFDLSAVPRNATIRSATLRVKLADPVFMLRQIGISTVSTAWTEGTDKADGDHDVSCFNWPGPRTATWAGPGSTVCDAIAGNGGTIASYTFAQPEADNWWAIDVDPRIAGALRVDSFGMAVQEETGWWDGRRANIMVLTRESKQFAPTLTVTWGQPDTEAPSAVADLAIDADGLADGQVVLTFTAGGDDGDRGKALGYEIRYGTSGSITAGNWDQATVAPRWETPRPKGYGETVRAWLTDLTPGGNYSFAVVAYDQSGNRSTIVATEPRRLPGPTPAPRLQFLEDARPPSPTATLEGKMGLWAVDELTKVDPVDGQVLDGGAYVKADARSGSHVWDGAKQTVMLTAIRGEIVAFNLIVEALEGGLDDVRIEPGALAGPGGKSILAGRFMLHRLWYLESDGRYYPEASPVLDRPLQIPATDNKVPGQTNQSVYVDLFVPDELPAGTYRGALTVSSSGGSSAINVQVEVLDLAMPDQPTFVIELNAYGWGGSRADYYAMHRLAHLHRVGYNTLSYGHSDSVRLSFLPKMIGEGAAMRVVDWSEWDRWMGPLLDGSAFEGLPRKAVPIPHFYLPFHENYPTKITGHYARPDLFLDRPKGEDGTFDYAAWKDMMSEYDVDIVRAFDRNWQHAAVAVARQWREHLIEKGWTATQYQIFCNDKHYYREPEGQGQGYKKATSLWTLDEPSFGRDFRALAYVYGAFKPAMVGAPLNVVCRGDVSRPQWQGDRLDGVSDLSVVSSALYTYQTTIQRRRVLYGDGYWQYGGGLGPDKDSAVLPAQYIKNWTLGADGGLAYWTSFSGGRGSWDQPNPLAIVHLAGGHGYAGPVGTMRLKAQRRAQQDVELLNMLAVQPGWSRNRVGRAVAAAINLTSKTEARGADDPGQTSFADIHASDLARIRIALAKEILAARDRAR